MITGGGYLYDTEKSAEIYHPDRDSPCVLPKLPDPRSDHTQDGELMCGGYNTRRSCRRWNPDTGAWDEVTNVSNSLTHERAEHVSWTPADGSGTYLMGGRFQLGITSGHQRSLTRMVMSDPHSLWVTILSKNKVTLTLNCDYLHVYRQACSIQEPETVVVTGGFHSSGYPDVHYKKVVQYDK